jgi:chromosome segregation ATPase
MTKDNLEGVQQKREYWGGEIGKVLFHRREQIATYLEAKRREEALKPAKSDPLVKEESPEVLSNTLRNHFAEITSNLPKVLQIAPAPGPRFEDLEDVKQQIVVLEERIDGTTSDLTTRLRELENQVYTDRCLLTELNWRSNELKKQENRVRADKKRSWKNNPRASHRYETRSVTANSNERANEVRKQLSQLTDQIKALEIKVETLRIELRSVKDKLDQVLVLEFEVKKLAKTVEDQRKVQGDMNSVLMSEIASLKFAIGPSVEHQLKQHGLEITALTTRYQQLYQVALHLLYLDNAANSNASYATHANHPSYVNNKSVGVF